MNEQSKGKLAAMRGRAAGPAERSVLAVVSGNSIASFSQWIRAMERASSALLNVLAEPAKAQVTAS